MGRDTLIFNPPDGHLYGFPKEIPEDVFDVLEWAIFEGYPREKVMYWEDQYIMNKSLDKEKNTW